eukprot:c36937_g1_i1.p1 GENE.c36937_g1_i1~~c36937_g1_i1.p1  ORF type:complete len:204 (+),score=44.92 c36937_g1_i1:677-1288(+)
MVYGSVILLGCVIVRNYPLWRFFDNKNLSMIKIPSINLILAVAFAVLIGVAIITPFSMNLIAKRDTFGCDAQNSATSSILLSLIVFYLFLLALIAARMCFKIRNIPSKFNNTKDIAISTYNFVVFGIAMGIVGSIATNPTTLFLAISLSITISVVTFTVFVHIKKIHQVFYSKKSLHPRPTRQYRSPVYFLPRKVITPNLEDM